MQEEFDALQRNQTWALVPRPPCANVITVKWVFKHKLRPDGTLERYKARWVVHGFRQRAGVDLTDRFALVVKLGTICTVLHLAASRAWPVHQMDVSNAFFMDTSPSRCTVSSPPASSTPITPSMCACSRAPCMA
jgi:histone deacetylase 1/2